jgi:sulfane dehydrogenase subunit SoxC
LKKDSIENSNKVESRRGFLRNIAASVVAAGTLVPSLVKADDPYLIEEPEWGKKLGLPVDKFPYGLPSPYEHNVVRRTHELLSSGDMYASVAMCPVHELDGIITPNGLFFNRCHGGVAIVDPNKYRLLIHGLVEKPLVLTLDDIKKYPSESVIHFIECPANGSTEWRAPQFNTLQFLKGMMSQAEWTGVRLKHILKDVGIKPEAKWVLAEGSDNSHMGRTIPLDKILDDAMVVWAQNGEALRPEQGYPIRLLLPGWEGNLNVKWLSRLEIGDKPWHAKEETSKYTMLMPDGRAVRFFWPMEVNSVITRPCPDKPWTHLKKGDIVEIEGLAWSGHGKIKGVDISFDGGKNWVEAKLKGLVLPKAWTRFSYMFKWEGEPLLLSSRAYDEVGNVQPTIDQEVGKMGVENIYHRNAIVTWEVKANGEVNNVQIRS